MVASIDQLEKSVLASKKNLNSILDIIAALDDESADHVKRGIHALFRIFSTILTSSIMEDTTKSNSINSWIKSIFHAVVDRLISLLRHAERKIRISALNALMDFIKIQARIMSESNKGFAFPSDYYKRIIWTCVCLADIEEDVVQALQTFYLNKYQDLTFYFLKIVPQLTKQLSCTAPRQALVGSKRKSMSRDDSADAPHQMEQLFQLLLSIKQVPEKINNEQQFFCSVDTKSGSQNPLFYPKGHRKAFSEAWLSFMKMDLTPHLYRNLLAVLHEQIIPNMADPRLLHDFLTDSYNQGGATSILALNGLFTLIHKHNLDYPEFYSKLYALFDGNLLHLKYRPRFLRLAYLFLTSSHLPAYLVAAFIKRMARLALFAPPAAILSVLPIMHNLLRQHQECRVLLHREYPVPSTMDAAKDDNPVVQVNPETASDEEIRKALLRMDPYDSQESDPAKCNAIESSLWELETLENHYLPQIANFVKGFRKIIEVKQMPFDVEDFMDLSYDQLIRAELDRKIKKTPPLNYQFSKTLFADNPLIMQSWSFE